MGKERKILSKLWKGLCYALYSSRKKLLIPEPSTTFEKCKDVWWQSWMLDDWLHNSLLIFCSDFWIFLRFQRQLRALKGCQYLFIYWLSLVHLTFLKFLWLLLTIIGRSLFEMVRISFKSLPHIHLPLVYPSRDCEGELSGNSKVSEHRSSTHCHSPRLCIPVRLG